MTIMPCSLTPGGAKRAAPPADRGLAGALDDLAYAAVRPLRYWVHYRRNARALARLGDDMLQDIGLARWDIRSFARSRAELRWPARRSGTSALAAVAAALPEAWRRLRERRMTIDQLLVLDERMLKDIGLKRSDIPWVADEMVRSLGKFGMGQRAYPLEVHRMASVEAPAVFIRRPSRRAATAGTGASTRAAAPANSDRVLRAS